MTAQEGSKRVVLGTIGDDAHIIGVQLFEYALRRAGFEVLCLGAQVSPEEFVEAARQFTADAVLVSSLYGHASHDCAGLRQKLAEAGMGDILLYVGGNLTLSEEDRGTIIDRFTKMGFDRVYPGYTDPKDVIKALQEDLATREKVRVRRGR